jgi:hypothetical protein
MNKIYNRLCNTITNTWQKCFGAMKKRVVFNVFRTFFFFVDI